jgi:urease accessory protein
MLDSTRIPSPPNLERAIGTLKLAVRLRGGATAVQDLHQAGCGRLLFPAIARHAPLEAVVVNTAGGVTGGDRFDVRASAGQGARLSLTTQACEKVYRSDGTTARVATKLKLEPGSTLHWLPQETIVFDGSNLTRGLVIDMAEDAHLVACEAVLLGRRAMGETLTTARLRDSWRIRRGGRLIFAEETRVDGDWPRQSARAALGADAAAFATLVIVGAVSAAQLERIRDRLHHPGVEAGASALEGLVIVRMIAQSGLALRQMLVPLLELATAHALPRVWQT